MSDPGYFPRGSSMLRRVHGERLVGLMYGQRALCIGACSPLNYVGTSEHSAARLTPFRRLAHTGKAFETIYFGTRRQADEVLDRVHRLHQQVEGRLPAAAGPTPAGTPYSALDPQLMLWTVAVIADSAQFFYELLVRRLTAEERDALWQDYRRFGELFGMPAQSLPSTYEDFRGYWRERIAAEDLFLTDEARLVGYATAFKIPFPSPQQPAKAVHDAVMRGGLPSRVRELYGLSYTAAQRSSFVAGVAAMRAGRRLAPRFLARGGNTHSFDSIAATEQWRIAHGRPTPQVPLNTRIGGGRPAR